MVFIAAGMGGGTGTGAAPLIAEVAKDCGALTVAVVTTPFSFESKRRRQRAERGIESLEERVDTLITIPNERLLSMLNTTENPTWEEALLLADTVLQQGIQAIAEVVTVPGEINLDFADVKNVLEGAGPAWMALGSGKGENRALQAVEVGLKSPLLDVSLEGAKRILMVVRGGPSMTLKEVGQAASSIEEIVDDDANVFFGTVKDPNMDDELRITLIATGFPFKDASRHQEKHLQSGALGRAILPSTSEEQVDSRSGPDQRIGPPSDEVNQGNGHISHENEVRIVSQQDDNGRGDSQAPGSQEQPQRTTKYSDLEVYEGSAKLPNWVYKRFPETGGK